MGKLPEVTDQTFSREVLEADQPVLVDFGAAWCHPCHQLDPIVEALSDEWSGRMRVVHVDADQNIDTTVRYQVMGLPTLILFIEGNPVTRMQGFQPRAKIVDTLEPHLPG